MKLLVCKKELIPQSPLLAPRNRNLSKNSVFEVNQARGGDENAPRVRNEVKRHIPREGIYTVPLDLAIQRAKVF